MKRLLPNRIFILVILVLSVIYGLGVASVPFHPDEATQIYMSSDLEIFFHQPSDTFWQSQPLDELRQHYRLVDAPLTRWMIGIGRWIFNQPQLVSDWSWSLTWQENQTAGALPDSSLLLVSRFSVAWLFPLTLFFTFRSAEKLGGARMGWIALVLMASNSLVLLHTRHAMAESALLFCVAFSLWALLRWKSHPWLTAVPLALAFNAKQSAAVLLLVGLFAIFLPSIQPVRFKRRFLHALLYSGICVTVTLLLNPVLWSSPLDTASRAWDQRQELVTAQVETLQKVSPDQVLDTLPKRFLGTLVNLYLNQPAVSDVANYEDELGAAANAYLANPLHTLLRDTTGGALLFALALLGFLIANRDAFKRPPAERSNLAVLLLATLLQFLSQVAFIPLPFQRYIIPLLPFACLWSAYCAARLLEKFQRSRESK